MATVSKMTISLMPDVADELARRVGEDGNRSMVINRSLKHWFAMMKQAKRKMEPQFSSEEKALILDATNGAMVSDDYTATLIWAEIDDAVKIDGLDKKWGVEDASGLVGRLRALTPPECFALAEAIQDWWSVPHGESGRDHDDLLKAKPK